MLRRCLVQYYSASSLAYCSERLMMYSVCCVRFTLCIFQYINLTASIAPELVAMGTFLNTDTTRIVAKRLVLTGHPFKVHKKTATVRYMFFNSGKSIRL